MSLAMPSIHPHRGFSANQDAEVLRGAMKGLGCNNSKIVSVLCARSNYQRQEIEKAYKAMYGRFLVDDLKSELSGDFEELILALMEPSALYDAKLMRKAMQGLGTNENLMVEVLCTRDNDQIAAMKAAYTKEFNRDMEKDVMSETSGDFKRLMISLLAGGRDQSFTTDHLRGNQDAHKLYKAGEGRLGTDESAFNCILASQNFAQLNLVFNEYEKIRGHSLEQALTSEFSDDILHAYQTIVSVVRSRAGYLAKQINESMKGFGTRDDDLIRLIVSRSEVDLADIRNAYQRDFNTALDQAIKGDCSGAYKDGLIALVKGN